MIVNELGFKDFVWKAICSIVSTKRGLLEWWRVNRPFASKYPTGRHFRWRFFDKENFSLKEWQLIPEGKMIVVVDPCDILKYASNAGKAVLDRHNWKEIEAISRYARCGYELNPPVLEVVQGALKISREIHTAKLAQLHEIALIPFIVDKEVLKFLLENEIKFFDLD